MSSETVMTTTEPAPGQQADVPTCYRHPRRETYTRCTRCDRHICPDCMRVAPVGHQCVQCVRDGNANRLILYSVVWLVATAGFTSWEGHLGGFLAGCGCAWLFTRQPRTILEIRL